MEWGNIAAWTGVLCSLGLGTIAIFQERIRQRLFGPVLGLAVEMKPPDCVAVFATPDPERYIKSEPVGYYIRMRVRNAGRSVAERVEVVAASVFQRSPDGVLSHISEFNPIPLRWSYFHDRQLAAMNPGSSLHIDVAIVDAPSFRHADAVIDRVWSGVDRNAACLRFAIQWNPGNEKWQIQPPGTYVVELGVLASNARRRTEYLEISLSGEWKCSLSQMLSGPLRASLLSENDVRHLVLPDTARPSVGKGAS